MERDRLDYLETLVGAWRGEALRRAGIRHGRLEDLTLSKNLDFVLLFGSFASGDAHTASDVDIAYRGGDGTPIDWTGITDRPVDAHDLKEASLSLRYEVAMTGLVLYERYSGAFMRFRGQVKKEFAAHAQSRMAESREGAVTLDEFLRSLG